MNPVLILTRNNLELTKRCVASVEAQDIPTQVCIVDNGSTDGSTEWARKNGYLWSCYNHNAGVSKAWNIGLQLLLEDSRRPHVLVLNNDTVLPPWFYRELLAYDVPFVTGLAQSDMAEIAEPKAPAALDPHPDFSAFLIRREAWEAVGPFDEGMKLYASDCDWHVRAHRKGISLWKSSTSYYHIRSSTIRLASDEERQKIQTQANEDRAKFRQLYGRVPGDPTYDELFK